jgi:hypothetical protein
MVFLTLGLLAYGLMFLYQRYARQCESESVR